jgi:hypothetical protein
MAKVGRLGNWNFKKAAPAISAQTNAMLIAGFLLSARRRWAIHICFPSIYPLRVPSELFTWDVRKAAMFTKMIHTLKFKWQEYSIAKFILLPRR